MQTDQALCKKTAFDALPIRQAPNTPTPHPSPRTPHPPPPPPPTPPSATEGGGVPQDDLQKLRHQVLLRLRSRPHRELFMPRPRKPRTRARCVPCVLASFLPMGFSPGGCTQNAHNFVDPHTGKLVKHLKKGKAKPKAKARRGSCAILRGSDVPNGFSARN